jgi:hypothetical protein
LQEQTLGPLKTIKHNPTQDKRHGLAKATKQLKQYQPIAKKLCNKTRIYTSSQKDPTTALAGKEPAVPRVGAFKARTKGDPSRTQPPPTTTNQP